MDEDNLRPPTAARRQAFGNAGALPGLRPHRARGRLGSDPYYGGPQDSPISSTSAAGGPQLLEHIHDTTASEQDLLSDTLRLEGEQLRVASFASISAPWSPSSTIVPSSGAAIRSAAGVLNRVGISAYEIWFSVRWAARSRCGLPGIIATSQLVEDGTVALLLGGASGGAAGAAVRRFAWQRTANLEAWNSLDDGVACPCPPRSLTRRHAGSGGPAPIILRSLVLPAGSDAETVAQDSGVPFECEPIEKDTFRGRYSP